MQKDQGGLIAIILASLVFVGSGVTWWLNYDAVMNETEGLKKQLKDAVDAQKVAEGKKEKMDKQLQMVSDLVGMQYVQDDQSSLLAMVNHLNLWATRWNEEKDAKTKYGQWMLNEAGLPVMKTEGEAGGMRDLCFIKDSRSPGDTRAGNETADIQQYLMAELENMRAAFDTEAEVLENEAKRAMSQHDENVGDGKSQGKLGTVIEEKTRRIKELREAIKSIDEQILRNQKESETAIADAEKAIRLKLDELDALKDKQEKLTNERRRKIAELSDRIFAITVKRQLAQESTEADGQVINAVPSELYGWIDIGRKDALLKGTRFEVFTLMKGGRKVSKGYAQVVDVQSNYSVISMLRDGKVTMTDGQVVEGKIVEKGNVVEVTERNGSKQLLPRAKLSRLDFEDDGLRIEKGDYVANEVFDRKKAKTFVFGGKLRGRYTNEQAAKLITDFGGLVDKEVQSETTYLVVGAEFEKDPNYTKAVNLGVKIIREIDLYEMLGQTR